MEIKRVKLFPNQNRKSFDLVIELEKKLKEYGYEVIDNDDGYDLAIAIGGDGSYLRMVKDNEFNSDIYYIGVNTGTLGFLQEIKPDEVDSFLSKLSQGLYKIEPVGIQETSVITKLGEEHFYSLNDITVRNLNLARANLNVYINDELLEDYAGDGLLVATTVGSTAYNLSLGGSIIYSGFHTLQLTPIAPFNTSAYRSLLNSIIVPEDKIIKIVPVGDTKDLLVSIDGDNQYYRNVEYIQTTVSEKKIKCLRMNDYNYTKIIYDKFLK